MTKQKKTKKPGPEAVRDAVAIIRKHGLSAGELVALFDLSQSWVTRARRADLPTVRNGRHDPAAVLAWIRARESEKPPPAAREDSKTMERWRSARADVAEIERELRLGQLVPRAEVAEAMGMACLVAKNRLFNAVTKVASQCSHLAPRAEFEVERVLRAEVIEVCEAFSRSMHPADYGYRWPPEDGASTPTATTTPNTASSTTSPAAATRNPTDGVVTGAARSADAEDLTDPPADAGNTPTENEE